MSVANFIPTIWSARILNALQNSLVYAQNGVVNTDYEGEITDQGDKVKIGSIGTITIKDYTKNTDMDAPEQLNGTGLELVIDQSKYFNFGVDDVDKAQVNINLLDSGLNLAGTGLKAKVDTFIANLMKTSVNPANVIGTNVAPKTIATASDAYDYLVDLSVILSENNVPEDNRWCAIPAWYHGLLQKDNRFVASGSANADDVLRNGKVGRVSGLTVLTSNNTPKTGFTFEIIAGHAIATTFADQILKLEAYRPEKRFGDAVKGLHVYGAKVIIDTALSKLYVTRP